MNKFGRWLFLITIFYGLPALVSNTMTEAPVVAQQESVEKHKRSASTKSKIRTGKNRLSSVLAKQDENELSFMDFYFDNTDLVDIINRFAAIKGFNIEFPSSTQGPITQKITFKSNKKLSLKEAERYIYAFLELSGYSLVPDKSSITQANSKEAPQHAFFKIIKTDTNTAREPLPLFMNVPPDELPKSEQRIRAVYYLANLKVPDTSSPGAQSPLDLMLKDMLSTNATYLFDPKSNGIIIVDKANVTASIMTIINELDSSGVRDTIEIVPLYNASAQTIADLLKTQQGLAIGGQRLGTKGDSTSYFSNNLRIVADNRINSLILMGRESAIERLKAFITEYLDIPIENGKSILHYYDLQYLDAEKFAADLQKIVSRQEGGDQSKQEFSGPESFFQGVIVRAEVSKAVEKAAEAQVSASGSTSPTEITKGTVYKGGNRLIIAARSQDWERIKRLIEQLDTPQPQVILEVLIADIVVEDDKLLGAQTRNPAGMDLPLGVNFQSANLTPPFTNGAPFVPGTPATTIAPDLLELVTFDPAVAPTNSIAQQLTNLAQGGLPGSLIISLNDPAGTGIWSVLQILQRYNNSKIMSHPFLVTLNNKEGHEVISEIRRDFGSIGDANSAAAVINRVDVRADVKVAIVPRISSSDRVNLQITVDINQFTDPNASSSNLQKITRTVETNANLHSGQILILGGLTRVDDNETETETPILGRIPILGWLFRKTQTEIVKTNLAIFICPTIVQPRIRDPQHYYTKRTVDEAYDVTAGSNGLLFDNLRDPITNFFFKSSIEESGEMMDNYLSDARDTGLLIDRHASLVQHKKMRPSSGCKPKRSLEKSEMANNNLKDALAYEENPLSRIKQGKTESVLNGE